MRKGRGKKVEGKILERLSHRTLVGNLRHEREEEVRWYIKIKVFWFLSSLNFNGTLFNLVVIIFFG